MNVTVEIEELVLHGFPAQWRYALAEALETEFAAQIAAGGLDGISGRDLDALPLRLHVPANASPREVGRLAAGELYRALEELR